MTPNLGALEPIGGAEMEPGSAASSVGGSSLTPPSTPGQDAGGSIGSGADLVANVGAGAGVEPRLDANHHYNCCFFL